MRIIGTIALCFAFTALIFLTLRWSTFFTGEAFIPDPRARSAIVIIGLVYAVIVLFITRNEGRFLGSSLLFGFPLAGAIAGLVWSALTMAFGGTFQISAAFYGAVAGFVLPIFLVLMAFGALGKEQKK